MAEDAPVIKVGLVRRLGGCSDPSFLHASFGDHIDGQRNRTETSDQKQSKSGGSTLIVVQTTREQEADPSAQRYAGSGDKDDLRSIILPTHLPAPQ
jgi:hypothetical protein